MNGAIRSFRDQQAVDQADDRAHRQRGDDGDADIFRLAVHADGRHQHRQLDDRADREVDAAADNDEGFANRHRAEKCAGPQHVEDVAVGQEVGRRQRGIDAQDQNQAVDDQQRGVAAQARRNAQATALGGGRRNRAQCRFALRLAACRRQLDNPFLTGLVAGQLGDNLALVHDQNPVAHTEDFRRAPTKSSEWRRRARQAGA